MGPPSVGDVVIIPFPYSDLTQSKRRPALVLAEVGRGDFLLCQITSKQYGDMQALPFMRLTLLPVASTETVSYVVSNFSLAMSLSSLGLLVILTIQSFLKLLASL